jgi:hypothetical protein
VLAFVWRLTIFTHIQNSFSAGELSPSVFGRTDLQKWHSGASTMRNFFVNYRGGAASRAGTAFVGRTKQGSPVGGSTVNNISGGTPINSGHPRDISFQFNLEQGYDLEFGDYYLRIKSAGAYVVEATNAITGISQANPGVFGYTDTNYQVHDGDWLFLQNIQGPTALNGLTFIVQNATSSQFTLTDLFGNPINTNLLPAYISGGTLARIYTVTTPYEAVDLPWLKFTQSADTMSLTCWNQITGTEYPPYDLERNGQTNWTLTEDTFASSIAAPTGLAATANNSTTKDTFYSYVVTAVASDGEESVASTSVSIENNNISIFAGSNSLSWNAINNAQSYNVYGATSNYQNPVPVGVLYGFLGNSLGTNFVDTNIEADFTTVPPTHQNPFAPGQILNVNPTTPGTGYTQAGVTFTINTSTGTGAIIEPIVTPATGGGGVVGFLVVNGGENYASTDTITITGDGTGATATLNIGPQTGTYPGVVAYFQQRRVYGNTQNNPDTYFMSQPGAFTNMDSSIPASDTDAIVGAPWAQQINGIQFMVPMPGGLVILTGSGAWQLTGGNSAAVTPADQDATPQAYNGCHGHIQPIVINYDILYVQSKGSIVRDLSYNFFVNIYTGTDTTVLSNQLFNNHQLVQWCYAEEPYKVIWAVRDDGILLSFTYLKEQDVYAWARHDTNGFVVSVVSVTEPPPSTVLSYPVTMAPNDTQTYIDAVYLIVQRFVQGQSVYYAERMDNRNWNNVEEAWCVDAGLAYPMTYPNATLTPAAAEGSNNISSVSLPFGGSGYTAPVIQAVDETGVGSGVTFGYTLSGGVITSIFPITQGQNYTDGLTQIQITDATGSGARAYPVITNIVAFTASANIFSAGNFGNVIRVGGGIATITSYISGNEVMANITQAITDTVPNDPNNTPFPQDAGDWTISVPTQTISGLNHLNGLQVTGLADGSVIDPMTVVNGSITLPAAASQITVGLPFVAQLQTLYLDVPGQDSSQGKRKNIYGVTVRMESSLGMEVGVNQVDASTQPNNANIAWDDLYPFKERNASVQAGQPVQLYTGDHYIIPDGSWDEKSQIAIQTDNPLPCNILCCIAWFQEGDTSG